MAINDWGPEPGDLLVSRTTATTEYLVVIIPTCDCVLRGLANSVVVAGLDLAQELGVDLWLTEDHIHFLRLAAFRSERPGPVDANVN